MFFAFMIILLFGGLPQWLLADGAPFLKVLCQIDWKKLKNLYKHPNNGGVNSPDRARSFTPHPNGCYTNLRFVQQWVDLVH